eukprot:1004952-Pelagomonas_calceolata.AAC.2
MHEVLHFLHRQSKASPSAPVSYASSMSDSGSDSRDISISDSGCSSADEHEPHRRSKLQRCSGKESY